ncbi:TRAP transporter solute receptor, TAXI family [Dethiosulfovibrio peptidovorans DSM 11002]|uniref:TRAP transporter solute receptor, TAXI family n=1 Tax=Dethiosulfovibrio peptidovorans DSM 11002 TaxID=469381 RepID=D2Z803_9BACT|nr:TAXI family TRAP transporter solute-binding subunit [Dethiosulfovibrio peptidovorans]EFC91600.1 TRAP transporter solute receptor, TAXI family [Dethiosulfovibrio peptidovorans DSM 11002]
MKKVLLALMALALMVGTVGTAMAEDPAQLRFMAGPPGGNWFALGGSLSDMWSKNGLPTTSGTGGGVSNIVNADRGKGDMGFSVTSMVGAATKGGEPPFNDPLSNVSVLANLYTQYTYFIVRKDFAEENGIKTVGDIVAKKLPVRFATLKPGTSSEFVIRNVFSKGYGINYRKAINDWGGKVEFSSYSDGSNLLADNHIDCFAFSVGRVASVVMQIESQTDIVILPVDEKARQAMTEAFGTVSFTIEPGIYKSVTEPVETIGDYTCVVVRNDLSDDLTYKLAELIWQNKETLAKSVKDMQELSPESAVPAAVPAHPGAAKFWKSVQ